MAFILTSCIVLFAQQLRWAMGLTYTPEAVRKAAILTFLSVILLSGLCTLIDAVRRQFMIERPVRRIVQATEKIMSGDFSVRIQPANRIESMESFDRIIGYINKMAEELSGLETLRTDFIANVSHELKTPLAVMQNYGTMLQQPGLSEEKRMEYAKIITESSGRLADLITNTLRLNKLENQQIYPDKTVYNLGEQLCECFLQFESTWEKKRIDIRADINVWAQILMIVFSILYGVISWRFQYWGEMMTYLGMTMPMAIWSTITWMRNPSDTNADEVKIRRLTWKHVMAIFLASIVVTGGFYSIFRFFDTPNIVFSTISITTSFIAASLTMLRSSYYALGYASNDIVLIVLWLLASIENPAYIPVVVNFVIFLLNDMYGFISWKKWEAMQS